MKKLFVTILILLIVVVIIYLFYNFKSSQDNNSEIKVSSHLNSYFPSGGSGQIVSHTGFSLLYNEELEQPYWVCYILTASKLKLKVVERSNKFTIDKEVATFSAKPDDYKHSGYDKGHLCPAANMKWSEQAMKECFYMSNMSPQVPGFNRGIWKKLEEKERDWAMENDSLVVITGPVFRGEPAYIGENKVGVPHYFYKIIADISYPDYKLIAFVMPNKDLKNSLNEYIVSVDSLESITHLDFFDKVPFFEKIENISPESIWP